MAVTSNIADPQTGRVCKVVNGGALAIAPFKPSQSFNGTLGVNDTVVNIVPVVSRQNFTITGILLTSNKSVSGTLDATVQIYTGLAADTTYANRKDELFTFPIGKSSSRDIIGIHVEVEAGDWINAVTDDDDVFVTILGYHHEA